MLRALSPGAACAAVLAVLLAAPAAHADPESDYLARLSQDGFNVTPSNRSTLLAAGNTICADLRAGTSRADEIKKTFQTWGPTAEVPKITAPQAAQVVEAAQLGLCPDTIG